MFGGTELMKVEYLGLLLSSDMSFSKHIESICSKARKITDFFTGDSVALLQLYLTMMRPHLQYAILESLHM